MPRLIDLPTELIAEIFDYAGPESHIELALTCRILHHAACPLLRRHQDAHRDWRVMSTSSPTAIFALIRGALHDPASLEAFHVRTLEICVHEIDLMDEDMKTFDFGWDDDDDDRVYSGLPVPSWFLNSREIEQCLEVFHDRLHFNRADVEEVRERLERGDDRPLQMLLLVLCPRVDVMKIIPLW